MVLIARREPGERRDTYYIDVIAPDMYTTVSDVTLFMAWYKLVSLLDPEKEYDVVADYWGIELMRYMQKNGFKAKKLTCVSPTMFFLKNH